MGTFQNCTSISLQSLTVHSHRLLTAKLQWKTSHCQCLSNDFNRLFENYFKEVGEKCKTWKMVGQSRVLFSRDVAVHQKKEITIRTFLIQPENIWYYAKVIKKMLFECRNSQSFFPLILIIKKLLFRKMASRRPKIFERNKVIRYKFFWKDF